MPRPKNFDPEKAFWALVDASGDCWEWIGRKNQDGYGEWVTEGKSWRVHRYSWTSLVGVIPEGLTIDHLCHVRHCVNPDHLEVVTLQENIRRRRFNGGGLYGRQKTECLRGHAYTPGNTYRNPTTGRRYCRECHRIKARMDYQT